MCVLAALITTACARAIRSRITREAALTEESCSTGETKDFAVCEVWGIGGLQYVVVCGMCESAICGVLKTTIVAAYYLKNIYCETVFIIITPD